MAKSSQTPSPRRDVTDKALIAFAEAVLDDHFGDPEQVDAYGSLLGRKRGRGKSPAVTELARHEFDDGGLATLVTGGEKWAFDVTLHHPKFSATVAMTYPPDLGQATGGSIAGFTGDRKTARKLADSWRDQLEDLSAEDLFSLLGIGEADEDDGSPFEGDDPGEPPPSTPADTIMIQRIARSIARTLQSDGLPKLTDEDEGWFDATPQSLWPILDGLLAAFVAKRRDEALVAAYRFLLGAQLELIRYRIDSGWEWARRMADEYQQKMIKIAGERSIPQDDWFTLVAALGEAKIEVRPEIREQLAAAGGDPEPAELSAELLGMLRTLMDQMADTAETPFDVVEAMADTSQVMPAGMRTFMMHEMAHSTHPKLREAVTLMLLDADQEVRRAAAAVLEQFATPETLSPESLRRMIAIRSWLPEADRPPLDRAIRKARTKDVVCAQWPETRDIVVTASMIDGSGAQTFVITTRTGRTGVFAGVLLKQGFGIRDTWYDPNQPRRETNKILATIRQETASSEVDRGHLDVAVQHAIASGLHNGHVAPANLLRVAEYAGGADWRDRAIDVRAEVAELFAALDPEDRGNEGIDAALRRSSAWMAREPFAASWFEDDAAIRAVVARAPKRDKAAAVRLLLTEGLPKGRMIWAERFVLLALWAASAQAREHAARKRDFVILAHELVSDRPLAEIPFMVAVAEQTLMAVRSVRW